MYMYLLYFACIAVTMFYFYRRTEEIAQLRAKAGKPIRYFRLLQAGTALVILFIYLPLFITDMPKSISLIYNRGTMMILPAGLIWLYIQFRPLTLKTAKCLIIGLGLFLFSTVVAGLLLTGCASQPANPLLQHNSDLKAREQKAKDNIKYQLSDSPAPPKTGAKP